MAHDPIALFHRWYAQAKRARAPLHDACALATADSRGRPSARFVLLKEADERGFVFYTNAASRKGRELKANPHAALVFYWDRTGRQVRIEGPVREVSAAEADAYWATRPRQSQLGAWASDQSRPVSSRAVLLGRVAVLWRKFRGRPVPRPRRWTGFRIAPRCIEFWTRGPFRLHDRLSYVRRAGGWKVARLQP